MHWAPFSESFSVECKGRWKERIKIMKLRCRVPVILSQSLSYLGWLRMPKQRTSVLLIPRSFSKALDGDIFLTNTRVNERMLSVISSWNWHLSSLWFTCGEMKLLVISICVLLVSCEGRTISADIKESAIKSDKCDLTGPTCLQDQCEGMMVDGYYQYCGRCDRFIHCESQKTTIISCPPDHVFDDKEKMCAKSSITCTECYIPWEEDEEETTTTSTTTSPTVSMTQTTTTTTTLSTTTSSAQPATESTTTTTTTPSTTTVATEAPPLPASGKFDNFHS